MLRKLNILTVDDELPIIYSLRFALGSPERVVASASDGEEALTRIRTHEPPFDVVITDNNMPRVNGLLLVRRLRDLSFGGKIVVLSANLSDEMRAAYEALHVDRLVPKPFDVAKLREVVEELAATA